MGYGPADDSAPVEGLGREVLAQRLAADRERIAHGLSDRLVHRMFAVSLELHGALSRIGDEHAAGRVRAALLGLDQAINELRNTIFDLGDRPTADQATAVGAADPRGPGCDR